MRIGEQLVGIVPVAKIRNSQQLLKNYTHKNKLTINIHITILLILLFKLKTRMYVCF